MIRATFLALLVASACALAGGQPPPPNPCEVPKDELKDLLAEGAELNGNEFGVPLHWNGKGSARVVIFDPANPKVTFGAAYTAPLGAPSPSWLHVAWFKGFTNREVIVYGYVGNVHVTGGVKVKIVGNPAP